MTVKEDKVDDVNGGKTGEPEIIATAIPTGVAEASGGGPGKEPPIPEGHSRFYCNKCRTVRTFFDEDQRGC